MTSDVESDAGLAARLRAGELSALDPIFRRHAPRLLRLAHQLTGSGADAEDVVQDVFVGLARALRQYEERGTFAEWLRGVVVRTALAHQRRSSRRRESAIEDEAAEAPVGRDPVEEIALADAIVRLPASLRTVFVLKAVEGYSHAEIGTLLGIRPNASEVRLCRAIRLLRTSLQGSPR